MLSIGQHGGMRHAVVAHPGIDLVGHDGDLGEVLEAAHQPVQLQLRHHAAGGVGRGVDDHEAGAGRDLRQHLLRTEGEALALVEGDWDGLSAAVLDERAVDREAGVRVHDLGPGLAEHEDGEGHRHLAAGHHHDAVGMDGHTTAGLHVLGHGLAQGQDAVGRRVAVVTVAECLDRGLDDVGGGGEVGLADAEIDDAAAGLGQGRGSRQDLEGALGA